MSNLASKTIVAALLAGMCAASALAQPSAKFGGSVGEIAMVGPTHSWDKVLSTTIKTANQKDLIVGVSMETGITTDTLVKSKGGTSDTSVAAGTVKVRVLVDRDGNGVLDPETEMAAPGEVTFDMREQTLMAKLGGIPDCTDVNGDGIYQISECTLTEEEIQLILKTMAAHHFNFIVANLPPGEHAVEVQAEITTNTSQQTGSANARAWIGLGSLTVEEVRGVSGEGFSL